MKKQILIGVFIATLTALCGCFILGDGASKLGTMEQFFYKMIIFYLPLLIILAVTLKILKDAKHLDIGQKLLFLVFVPNIMLMPLIVVWLIFGVAIQKAFS